MKSSAKKIELASVDDLFYHRAEGRQDAKLVKSMSVSIPLSAAALLQGVFGNADGSAISGQPYRVKDDEAMM